MARNRKPQAKKEPTKVSDIPLQRPLPNEPEISEEESWRLVQQSGLLQKIDLKPPELNKANVARDDDYPLAEELFDALLMIVPFSFLLAMMEMLVAALHY